MQTVGYAQLIERLGLRVRPLIKRAFISGSVNRRMGTADQIVFPRGVAIEDSIAGHLDFALRHEGVNLEVVDALFTQWREPAQLADRLRDSPNSATLRKACHLWEWLTGNAMVIEASPTAGYVALFPEDDYVTAQQPMRDRKFRVNNNGLRVSASVSGWQWSATPLLHSSRAGEFRVVAWRHRGARLSGNPEAHS
ncbi:hypothetical protein [Bordetella ansorpii]|uniref:hypothetical protein n=1 Tax=Bordetella ansorpii TaxID=288768 RepID=UPI001E2D447D|nr:hypothetical protein [Bordetella ansorpii]